MPIAMNNQHPYEFQKLIRVLIVYFENIDKVFKES